MKKNLKIKAASCANKLFMLAFIRKQLLTSNAGGGIYLVCFILAKLTGMLTSLAMMLLLICTLTIKMKRKYFYPL